MKKKYCVRLKEEQRERLEEMLRKGKAAAYQIKHANVLLKVDENGSAWSDEEVAKAFGCYVGTVHNIRRWFCERGFEGAIRRKRQERLSRQPVFDGQVVGPYFIGPVEFIGVQDWASITTGTMRLCGQGRISDRVPYIGGAEVEIYCSKQQEHITVSITSFSRVVGNQISVTATATVTSCACETDVIDNFFLVSIDYYRSRVPEVFAGTEMFPHDNKVLVAPPTLDIAPGGKSATLSFTTKNSQWAPSAVYFKFLFYAHVTCCKTFNTTLSYPSR